MTTNPDDEDMSSSMEIKPEDPGLGRLDKTEEVHQTPIALRELVPKPRPSITHQLKKIQVYPIDAGVIRCICGLEEDDGFTIQCESCNAWQHASCVEIYDDEQVPDTYLCERCSDRPVNAEAARKRQLERVQKQKLTQDTSRQNEDGVAPSTPNLESMSLAASSRDPTRKKVSADGTSTSSGDTSISPRVCAVPPATKSTSPPETWTAPLSSLAQTHIPAPKRGRTRRLTSSNAAKTADSALTKSLIDEDMDLESQTPDGHKLSDDRLVSCFYVFSKSYHTNDIKSEQILHVIDECLSSKPNSAVILSSHDFKNIKSARVTVKTANETPRQKFAGIPKMGLFCEVPLSPGEFVMELPGELSTPIQYKRQPLNQFRRFAHVKPSVFECKELNLIIDARRFGTESRFTRRSCTPNVCLKPIIIQDCKRLHFALYTTNAINPGDELTMAWEFDDKSPVSKLISGQPLLPWEASFLTHCAQMFDDVGVDSACGSGTDCILARMRLASGPPIRATRNALGSRGSAAIDTFNSSVEAGDEQAPLKKPKLSTASVAMVDRQVQTEPLDDCSKKQKVSSAHLFVMDTKTQILRSYLLIRDAQLQKGTKIIKGLDKTKPTQPLVPREASSTAIGTLDTNIPTTEPNYTSKPHQSNSIGMPALPATSSIAGSQVKASAEKSGGNATSPSSTRPVTKRLSFADYLKSKQKVP